MAKIILCNVLLVLAVINCDLQTLSAKLDKNICPYIPMKSLLTMGQCTLIRKYDGYIIDSFYVDNYNADELNIIVHCQSASFNIKFCGPNQCLRFGECLSTKSGECLSAKSTTDLATIHQRINEQGNYLAEKKFCIFDVTNIGFYEVININYLYVKSKFYNTCSYIWSGVEWFLNLCFEHAVSVFEAIMIQLIAWGIRLKDPISNLILSITNYFSNLYLQAINQL